MTEKDSNVEESVLEVEQASQVELDSEQISPAEKESVVAEEKGLSTDVDIPDMTAPDDEKSAFFEQWKARHQAYLAHKDDADIQAVDEGQTEQKIPEAKKSKRGLFQGINRRQESLESKKETEKKVQSLKVDIPSKVVWKAIPVLVTSLLLAALALYFISPTSKKKQIEVVGNERLTAEQVENYSLISPDDYNVTIALHADAYAKNIKKNSSSVETATIKFQFPATFTIQIKEYAIIGYIQQQSQWYPVLASGEVGGEPISQDSMPEGYTTINLSDKELIKELAIELGKIDTGIRSAIQTINLTPSKVTADLLTLNMADGNTVLVPLSEISQKLPYYTKIAAEVTVPTTIDMEVGIYRYAS
ncbi:FtsQ-type POTRA domain-containing protein [Streptococcus suis]|uniref:cell division protein FtsQ/DivIB n=1 Tax=Streptococcus suis TaxID=1307 RepID=UPI0024123F57|nr:FtsQ-type POTRA domain-containing protein [Streptococcus suis]MDG4506023.1 FtsQ-type POTRA domain-containing protein [Streptococcus suis]HEM2827020.1 FtsQ-type POTRA domain-containing protein [Streptococcus suis]HEM4403003.1 FtsQ-type POTRA domain-containing protein [Streptococcus suis]